MAEQKKKSNMTMILLLVLIAALLILGYMGWQSPDSYPGKLVAPLKHFWTSK
jgi:hypothetical protein